MNKNIILFDDPATRDNLLPLSFTRPLADLRVGITTIKTKWQHVVAGTYSYLTVDYLSKKFPVTQADNSLYVAGNVCPSYDPAFAEAIDHLQPGDALFADDTMVAYHGNRQGFDNRAISRRFQWDGKLVVINWLYDIFGFNGQQIAADFAIVDKSDSTALSPTNRLIGPETDSEGNPMIYIAPGASVEGAIINTTAGPVFIGEHAEIMEGSCLRGPIAVCRHGVVNMGTKIYPATTIGPWSKVGGELNNVVITGYSNKAHDGFLGNAVLGEWCNLGAGCVASNLKNDYTPIKLWNYPAHRFLKTGLQFCGLIMGDHSKAGINTMFNTATVVGVGVNVHGAGFPRNFIPSFSEGGTAGFSDVSMTKFFDIASRVMARRGKKLTDDDIQIFESIYQTAENYK